MAAPTPTTYTQWDGTAGMTYWSAVFTGADDFSDGVVVDISALDPAPTAVKVIGIYATLNGDITATLEFDADTDQLIYEFQNQSDAALREAIDFREGPSGGRVPDRSAAGFVGDILITTAGVANLDELKFLIFYRKK